MCSFSNNFQREQQKMFSHKHIRKRLNSSLHRWHTWVQSRAFQYQRHAKNLAVTMQLMKGRAGGGEGQSNQSCTEGFWHYFKKNIRVSGGFLALACAKPQQRNAPQTWNRQLGQRHKDRWGSGEVWLPSSLQHHGYSRNSAPPLIIKGVQLRSEQLSRPCSSMEDRFWTANDFNFSGLNILAFELFCSVFFHYLITPEDTSATSWWCNPIDFYCTLIWAEFDKNLFKVIAAGIATS